MLHMTDIAAGAWAASLTPLNDDLSVDYAALAAHVRWLLAEGAGGVAVLGTTGEANSFSVAERLDLIGSLAKAGFPPERIVIGTGCCAAPDTIALTRAALEAGFPNVMMLPPFYYKIVSEEGLFQAFARAIEAVNDPRLRVIIYDFPLMTGLTLSTALLVRLRAAFPETVIGVKNSSGDWRAMEDALAQMPGFQVFAGTEQFLLPTLRAGGPGCISATANVTIGKLAKLAAAWREPRADVLQDAATSARLSLQSFPAIPALKEMMAHASGRAAWRNVRPPLVNLNVAQRTEVLALAKTLDLSLPA
ncbi:dihydrodipicolinate synthase family [alpha proteobacterium U9-1i]|nr:dihydrodipicolinate synthase family [alpha proteobacterium U9-1i]